MHFHLNGHAIAQSDFISRPSGIFICAVHDSNNTVNFSVALSSLLVTKICSRNGHLLLRKRYPLGTRRGHTLASHATCCSHRHRKVHFLYTIRIGAGNAITRGNSRLRIQKTSCTRLCIYTRASFGNCGGSPSGRKGSCTALYGTHLTTIVTSSPSSLCTHRITSCARCFSHLTLRLNATRGRRVPAIRHLRSCTRKRTSPTLPTLLTGCNHCLAVTTSHRKDRTVGLRKV